MLSIGNTTLSDGVLTLVKNKILTRITHNSLLAQGPCLGNLISHDVADSSAHHIMY